MWVDFLFGVGVSAELLRSFAVPQHTKSLGPSKFSLIVHANVVDQARHEWTASLEDITGSKCY